LKKSFKVKVYTEILTLVKNGVLGARDLMRKWVDQIGPISGVHERKQFDQLIGQLVDEIEKCDENENCLKLIYSLVNGMGSYLDQKPIVKVTGAIIKNLTGKEKNNFKAVDKYIENCIAHFCIAKLRSFL